MGIIARLGSKIGLGVTATLAGGAALWGLSRNRAKHPANKEEAIVKTSGEVALERLNNFGFHKREFHTPALAKLIGMGKVKLVYTGDDDLVYMVARDRFFNKHKLFKELEVGTKIKKGVYLANFQSYLEGTGLSGVQSKVIAEELVKKFPSIRKLIHGLQSNDARLMDYFTDKSTGKVNWDDPILKILLNSSSHLAVDFAVSPQIMINGQIAILTKKAECDLEKAIRTQSHGFPESLVITKQLLKGFRDLHKAGYIHGDAKLDNVLMYHWNGNPVVKIADWGKAKRLNDGQFSFRTGNARFMAPERLDSKKGEVFSAGMLAVRVLEEEFLRDSSMRMLIKPDEIDHAKAKLLRSEADPIKRRRGIELFLSVCKGSPEVDSNWSTRLPHVIGSIKSLFNKFRKHKINIDSQIDKYLEALRDRLEQKYGDFQQKRKEIGNLIVTLNGMMRTNIDERMSMEEAVVQLEKGSKEHHLS